MSATRARAVPLLIIACLALIGACSGSGSSTATSTQQVSSSGPATSGSVSGATTSVDSTESASADPAQAAAILDLVEQEMQTGHLRAVLVRVTRGGQDIVTAARGESMTGVPATS